MARWRRRCRTGTALDGEIVVARAGAGVEGIEAFAKLQQRLNRKVLTDRLTGELPAAFIAYDLLEEGGADLRALPQIERRARLERIVEARGRGARRRCG